MKTTSFLITTLLACTALAQDPLCIVTPSQLCYTGSIPNMQMDWPAGTHVSIPQFDPERGTLLSVQVSMSGVIHKLLGAERIDAIGYNGWIGSYLSAWLEVDLPTGVPVISASSQLRYIDRVALGPFDGLLNYAGTSGVTIARDIPVNGVSVLTEDLAAFIGADDVNLPAKAWAKAGMGANGSGWDFILRTSATITVDVCYTYIEDDEDDD